MQPNYFDLPPELQSLIEKRELPDRRATDEPADPQQEPAGEDRRQSERRGSTPSDEPR